MMQRPVIHNGEPWRNAIHIRYAARPATNARNQLQDAPSYDHPLFRGRFEIWCGTG